MNLIESVNAVAYSDFNGNLIECIKTNYEDILKAIHAIGARRPLTEEEIKIGRIAAKQHGRHIADERKRSEAELRATMMKMLKAQGYNEREAEEELRLSSQRHRENIGLGKSRRCRFVWLQ